MTLQTVKVSSKHQIALPAAVRRELGIHSGDELIVDICAGHVVLVPKPKSPDEWADSLAGVGKQVWAGVDARDYVRAERDAWDHCKTWNR